MTILSEKSIKGTKELIIEAAIKLFSQNGYDGTSIRSLAREVRIKESSIYNHFKGKKEILTSILDFHMENFKISEESLEGLELIVEKMNDPVEIWMTGTAQFLKTTHPLSEQIGILIGIEMYRNEECRNFVLDVMLPTHLTLTKKILTMLKEKDLIINCNIEKISKQYIYMIYGMEIENRLLTHKEFSEENIRTNIIETVVTFVNMLKKQEKKDE